MAVEKSSSDQIVKILNHAATQILAIRDLGMQLIDTEESYSGVALQALAEKAGALVDECAIRIGGGEPSAAVGDAHDWQKAN